MNINKFKTLSVAICCAVTALWTEIQGMEEPRDKPAGSVMQFAGEMAPNGWMLCHGQECFSMEYPKLYEVIKTKYVPANEKLHFLEFNENSENKKFRVPDLRGRVIVGVDGGTGRVTANNTLGASGGDESVAITIDQMPKHHHDIYGGHASSGPASFTSGNCGIFQSLDTGGGQPHNNMQPYMCLNYIINTGICNRQNNQNVNSEIIEQLQRQILELNLTLANLPVMPIGSIMEYSGAVGISANFLECNGAVVSRVTYAQLFANIGTTYGNGDNVTTFNLPDKRGRVSVGIDSNNNTGGRVTNSTALNQIALGGTFGAETHQLTVPELASHQHVIDATLYGGRGNLGNGSAGGYANSNNINPISSSPTGGNQPHNNVQPSIFMKFYIRAI